MYVEHKAGRRNVKMSDTSRNSVTDFYSLQQSSRKKAGSAITEMKVDGPGLLLLLPFLRQGFSMVYVVLDILTLTVYTRLTLNLEKENCSTAS